jgi:hypothetical protein
VTADPSDELQAIRERDAAIGPVLLSINVAMQDRRYLLAEVDRLQRLRECDDEARHLRRD